MAKRITGNCTCGARNVEAVAVTIRIMSEHRDEIRSIEMCASCAAATRANGLAA